MLIMSNYRNNDYANFCNNIKTGSFFFEFDIIDEYIPELSEMIQNSNGIQCIIEMNGPGGGNPCVTISHKNKNEIVNFMVQNLCEGDIDIFEELYDSETIWQKTE